MEIIDAHAHIYPHKIADKATKAVGDFYNIPMEITIKLLGGITNGKGTF